MVVTKKRHYRFNVACPSKPTSDEHGALCTSLHFFRGRVDAFDFSLPIRVRNDTASAELEKTMRKPKCDCFFRERD